MTSDPSKEVVMTRIIDIRRRSAAAAIVLAATVALGAGVASARDDHHWDHGHPGWGGGYYRAPPVVYGAPYYAPPPVVYGPGIGLNINIR
jgi:hypothetical protein